MATFHCPDCGKRNPVVGVDTADVSVGKAHVAVPVSLAVHVPAADRCRKCGADLLEPALEALDQLPYMGAKTAAEILELDEGLWYRRLAALELRAELCERQGRMDEARHDRLAAIEELDALLGARSDSADDMVGRLLWRAVMKERAGEQTDAARDRLRAADVRAALAGEPGAEAAIASPLVAAVGGLALGIESSDAARAGATHMELKAARLQREALITTGRAVGLGFCKNCGGVVEVSSYGRCPRRHTVVRCRYVVPEDAETARAELTEHPVGA